MTVSELITFLHTQPKDLQVAYRCYSEQCLLCVEEIGIEDCCEPRPDGWIHHSRQDKPKQRYLLLPGN